LESSYKDIINNISQIKSSLDEIYNSCFDYFTFLLEENAKEAVEFLTHALFSEEMEKADRLGGLIKTTRMSEDGTINGNVYRFRRVKQDK
jgi:hypothetical protein